MENKSEVLRDEYRMRFGKYERYRDGVWKILCREYFERFIAPTDHVLDLGCGWGEFIRNVAAGKKYAMDLNPDAALRLSPGITFLQQDCSREWEIPSKSVDVVFTSNFLEHLPERELVERTVAEARRCLKPGGLIICLGPNIKYAPGAYWDFWDHIIPISERSLAELLRLKGFQIRVCLPRFLPFSMSTGRTPPLFLVKWYLKLPVFWPLFGKQFLVVAQTSEFMPQ